MDCKVLITYSSNNGSTKKLAEGIYDTIDFKDKTISRIEDVKSVDEYDFLCVGYWVDKGQPNEVAINFIKSIKNKNVFLFATLGAFPESKHAYESVQNGENALDESNTIYGTYICQGAVAQKVIDMFKSFDSSNSHSATPLKLFKYDIGKKHPSNADILVCSERIQERIEYYIKSKEQ